MDCISTPPEVDAFLQQWSETPEQTRKAFEVLRQHLLQKENLAFEFVARPGVSYSLRAKHHNQSRRPLFAMVDVVDDDPSCRWLSVCFFGDMISDPDERGDFVPEGLLGEDALCFDIDAWDDGVIAYVVTRLDEAYAKAANH